MTTNKSFKERVRSRAEKTGESYTAARRQLIERSETEALKRSTPKTVARTKTSDETLEKNTGKTWSAWLLLLDRWGAKNKKHGEIAGWLSEEHGVDGWWAQHLTVAYEQERGMRAPGQRADGKFSVSASKTVAVDVASLFDAFLDGSKRERWLGEHDLNVRTSRSGKSMTADWEGSTRLAIGFQAKGDNKSQVALAHEKITTAQEADELKMFWKKRMLLLKKLLEDG